MAEFAIPAPGTICWRELATNDIDGAKAFYSRMFGWNLEQSKITEIPYTEVHIDGKAVGGMMAMAGDFWGENPPPSHWTTYVAVADVDATVETIKANGGSIYHGPFNAAGVGRMAFAADPCNAAFAIIQFEQPV